MNPSKTLMISDELEAAQIWCYILKQKGIETSLVTPSDDDTTERRPEYGHDLILIDVNSAQMNVMRLIRQMRTETTVPILLLFPRDDDALALEAYEAGADDVIIKPINPRVFLAKVKAWLRRSWTIPASMLQSFQVGDFRLDPTQRNLTLASGTVIKLTSLEFRLLHLLMSRPNQTLESSLIVDRVWGANGGGDNTLLKNVVYRLRRKIEPDPSQPCYILSVSGEGYMFVGIKPN
jgi:two-component system, OmpR family, response regulator MtrA